MPVCTSACPSVCLSICVYCVFVCFSVRLPVCLPRPLNENYPAFLQMDQYGTSRVSPPSKGTSECTRLFRLNPQDTQTYPLNALISFKKIGVSPLEIVRSLGI